MPVVVRACDAQVKPSGSCGAATSTSDGRSCGEPPSSRSCRSCVNVDASTHLARLRDVREPRAVRVERRAARLGVVELELELRHLRAALAQPLGQPRHLGVVALDRALRRVGDTLELALPLRNVYTSLR